MYHILGQMNRDNMQPVYFFMIHFNITLHFEVFQVVFPSEYSARFAYNFTQAPTRDILSTHLILFDVPPYSSCFIFT
jgi:hypothetical protein